MHIYINISISGLCLAPSLLKLNQTEILEKQKQKKHIHFGTPVKDKSILFSFFLMFFSNHKVNTAIFSAETWACLKSITAH